MPLDYLRKQPYLRKRAQKDAMQKATASVQRSESAAAMQKAAAAAGVGAGAGAQEDQSRLGSGAQGTTPTPGPEPAQAAVPTPYSIDDDPALAAIKAGNMRSIADAEAAAQNAKLKLALQLGDRDFAMKLGLSPEQIEAAANNPFSQTRNLGMQMERNTRDLNAEMGNRNLFYSSTRAQGLSDVGTAYQQQLADAFGGASNQYDQITQALLGAREDARSREEGGIADATNRGIDFALKYPGSQPAESSDTPADGLGAPDAGKLQSLRDRVQKLRQQGMSWDQIKKRPVWAQYKALGGK